MDGKFEAVRVGALPLGDVGGKSDWNEVLSPLKEAPKEWFRLREFQTSAAAHCTKRNLTLRLYKSFPQGKWEFSVRRINGEWTLFGTFIGDEE